MDAKGFTAFKQAKAEVFRQEEEICAEAREKIQAWVLAHKGIDITKRNPVNHCEYRLPNSHILADEHEFISVIIDGGGYPHFIQVPRTAIFPA